MEIRRRLDELFKVLHGLDSILVVPHNDPDPDAIASALALHYLLTRRLGLKAQVAYKGIIGRAENRALVRYLHPPIRHLKNLELRQRPPIALVDTQPGAGNNPWQPRTTPTVVIDHHPWREETAAAAFADVRAEVGATSTILTEYLRSAEVDIPSDLATALFYGIKTDTMGLGRGASSSDADAYFYLQPRIDVDALVEIERAQVPPEYFKSFATTLQAAHVYGDVIVSYVGPLAYPDLAAEMADLLLRLGGIRWVLCIGVYRGELIISVRTRSRRGGAGQLVRAIVGERGMAGGHGTMAGGHIPLQGEDPGQMAQQLSQLGLRYLKVPAEMAGEPLI